MNVWLIIGLALLFGVLILGSIWLFGGSESDEEQVILESTSSGGGSVGFGNIPNAYTEPGLQPVAVKITAKECRNKCRSQCGGMRPIIRLTKRQKDRGACWDDCRGNSCGWVPVDQLNG